MDELPRSPRIAHLSWGRLEVDDGRGGAVRYKDAKLFPGGSRAWDWRETGTEHVPGVQMSDLEELLENGARVIVLSRGMEDRLEVPPAIVSWLEDRGIRVEVHSTRPAVERYNDLARNEPVGGLFHSTC